MSYQGDIAEDQAFAFNFTTRTFSTGVPGTLAGSPALTVYKDANTTGTLTGPTLAADFSSITGLNNVLMATTDAFYVTGSDYSISISTGTVGGVSVVGEVVATFSIENRGVLRATTAANTKVDVTATGAVGIDWANVENQATSVVLSETTVDQLTALTGDAQTLPGQGAPSATATLAQMVNWLYKAFRNRKDQTATLWQLYADDETTVDSKAITSDNGALAVKQEIITGA